MKKWKKSLPKSCRLDSCKHKKNDWKNKIQHSLNREY